MIVVTTPTGSIGHQVLENLLRSEEPIRVIVRDPSRLPLPIRERVEVIQGSHSDSDIVERAFEGADSVFWLVPPASRSENLDTAFSGFTRPACEAIVKHAVKRVVGVSALGRGTSWEKKAGLVTASLAMDDLIASTGVNYRALTMPSFMDNMLRQVEPVKNQSTFYSPTPADLKAPTCATRDIASTAARLLLDSSWSGQGEVPVLGPEDLSGNDMAQIMSEVLGKPIRYQEVPLEAFKSQLQEQGMSQAFIQGYYDMMVAKSNGLDNAQLRTPEATTPTSFRQWCEEVLKPALLR